MKYWAIIGRTESGDQFQYFVQFRGELIDNLDAINQYLARKMPEEYADGGETSWRAVRVHHFEVLT